MDERLALDEIDRLHSVKMRTPPAWTQVHTALNAKIIELVTGLEAQNEAPHE